MGKGSRIKNVDELNHLSNEKLIAEALKYIMNYTIDFKEIIYAELKKRSIDNAILVQIRNKIDVSNRYYGFEGFLEFFVIMSIFSIAGSLSQFNSDYIKKGTDKVGLTVDLVRMIFFFICIILVTRQKKISVLLLKIHFIVTIVMAVLTLVVLLFDYNLSVFLLTLFSLITSTLWLIYLIRSKRVKYTLIL
jgi:hypothetical protein